jgi:uncharacterized protein DUF6573
MPQSTNKTPASPGYRNLFGEVIYSYTRKQAIDDGVLIDATEMARDAGFKWPLALTAAAWADCVAWSDADNECQVYQDQSGRLWDVLFMASYAIQSANNANRQLIFGLQRIPRNGHSTESQRLTLKLILGPGDGGEPVITIMLPEED